VFTGFKMLTCVIVMARQPSDTSGLSFAVPLGLHLIFSYFIFNVFYFFVLKFIKNVKVCLSVVYPNRYIGTLVGSNNECLLHKIITTDCCLFLFLCKSTVK
jgi:hypothetical protein